jgi:hypothetical protein
VLGSGQFGAPSVLPGRVAGLRGSDGVGDEVVLVAVERATAAMTACSTASASSRAAEQRAAS